MRLFYKLLCSLGTLFLLIHQLNAIPDLSQTSREPVITVPGADAYISCKVKDLGNHTVLFRKLDALTTDLEGDLLTVGNLSLRDDNRYQVLHERRHDIWLLKIKNVTDEDSGIFICEVNSKPKKKVTRLLKIVKESPLINTEADEDGSPPIALHEISHNYSDCCIANNVPTGCLDYCEFSQLVQNNKQGSSSLSSRMCFNHIGSITKCLTDGRDHMPCCVENHIPKVCQPICQGNFSLTAVTDYFTCMDFVAPLLACIGKGIKLLPPKPVELMVEPNIESLVVKWSKPLMDSNLINHYLLNVTQLHSFDEIPGQPIRNRVISSEQDERINKNSSETPSMFGLQLSYKVNGSLTEFHLFNLKPFTIYELVMSSHNKFGSSLPTEIIRTVTLAADSKPAVAQQNRTSNRNGTTTSDNGTSSITKDLLPDVKGCCKRNGVAIQRCIDVMCDPVRADETTLTDIMICAPYSNVTFKCMVQDVDHRPCCLAKGVPSLCSTFCDGKVSKLDFRHFICLRHMSSYQSCILDHYGVLPSEPIDFHVTSVHHNWAILRWKPPNKNKNTVKEYHVYYRESLKDKPNIFNRSVSTFAPYLLDGLNANSRYEVFVSAVNQYGIGQGSSRIIFFTPPISDPPAAEEPAPNDKDIILDKNNLAYNETECCVNAKLAKHCMPLCSYQMKITDVLSLAPKCGDQMSALVRCGSGGRNHIPCCQRRGVSESCLNLCAGIVETSPMIIARSCSSDLGKILRCMEEGTDNIPGMPVDLHAIKVTDSSIQLLWKPAEEDRTNTMINYQVRYGKVDVEKPLHPLEHNQSLNTTYPNAMLTGLEKGAVYSIYVVAANNFGISLPSLVLLVNTTEDARGLIKSGIGSPHALEVIYQNVDSITFSWLPPLFVPPDVSITYIVNYKTVNGTELDYIPTVKDKWIKVETRFNTMIITNLTYNTQYAIGVQAKVVYHNASRDDKDKEKNKIEISPLSEMIVVWTDPIIPASVNLPVTIPAGPIIEGHNLTALCVCSGNPTPTLSIYINGVLVKREEKRHLTYTVSNVQRQVSSITCYAINGYGNDMQSSQSTLEVKVRFKPIINMNNNDEELTNTLNSTAAIKCEVSGNPQPQVTWHKQKKGFDIVQFNDNIDIISTPHNDLPFTWINTLLIKRITEESKGKYLCEASNVLGKANKIIDLNVDTTKINDRNYTDCCEREGISPACMKVCHFDINIQLATTIPACYNDLDKLMFCAADGSDHRQCCRRNQVPTGCVQWCRGSRATSKREQSAVYCALAASPTIVKCFQEGSALLPGPVHQLELVRFSKENSSAEVRWSLPSKNPELVQYYKVYFRPIGSKDLTINITNSTTFELANLDTSKLYEFVVKAGNSMGLSIFSEPLVIGFNEYSKSIKNNLASELSLFNAMTTIGRLIANLLTFAAFVGLIGGSAYYAYNRFSYKIKPPPGAVSFDNPSYLKETNSVSFSSKKVDATHMDNLSSDNNNNDNLTDQDDKMFFK